MTQTDVKYETTARVIADEVKALHGHEVITIKGPDGEVGTFAVVPKGKELHRLTAELEALRTRPRRATGTATLEDERSFVGHVLRSADAGSVVFVSTDRSAPKFTAVYDYHEPSPKIVGADTEPDYKSEQLSAESSVRPRWGKHRAVYMPRLSDEWRAWHHASGRSMSPVDFAEFLEERIVDVYAGTPSVTMANLLQQIEVSIASPSQLVGLTRNLNVNVDTVVRHAQTLSSGEISIVYNETHKDDQGQPIKVPNAFLIAIPVFVGGPTYQVLVRLRYRLVQQKITWALQLHQTPVVFDHAMEELAQRIHQSVQLPVLLGAPEA